MIATEKQLGLIDSVLLAEYILMRLGRMSHLKLQKLIYYIQAYHLAYFERPIVEDSFEAWVHGPVSRKLFSTLRDQSLLHSEIGYEPVDGTTAPDEQVKALVTDEQFDLLNEVLGEFGTWTGPQLENLTHSEDPWIAARKGYSQADRCEVQIDPAIMMAYYKTQLYGEA